MGNHWRIMRGAPFAEWRCSLIPRAVFKKNPEIAFEIGTRIEELCSIYKIAHLLKTEDPDFERSETETFSGFMMSVYEEKGSIPFFIPLDRPEHDAKFREVQAPSQICYYKNGILIEEEIDDLGAILKASRPEDVMEYDHFMYSISPVVLHGLWISPQRLADDHPVHTHVPELYVQLYSNIWFPRLEASYGQKGVVDNRELAECHTPRFNAWLQSLHDLVTKYGGKWEVDKYPTPDFYKEMVTPYGIEL